MIDQALSFYDESHANALTPFLCANPQITLNIGGFRPSTSVVFQTKSAFFDGNWTATIDDDLVSKIFILIPESVKLTELMHFEVTLKVINKRDTVLYSNTINLDLITLNHACYQGKSIQIHTVDSYHYIPLCLLETNNPVFWLIGNYQIEISMSSEKYRIPSGLKYFATACSLREIKLYRNTERVLYHNNVRQYDINSDSFVLDESAIRYIIWKIDREVPEVRLSYEGTQKIWSKGDFQYLERARVELAPLSEKCGAIYFCLNPYDTNKYSGCLFTNQTPARYVLEFPMPVHGKIWVVSYQIIKEHMEHIVFESVFTD